MKRLLVLIIIAFLISGGTVGILYQEGLGGLTDSLGGVLGGSSSEEAASSDEALFTESDLSAAQAEEQDTEAAYSGTEAADTGAIADTGSEAVSDTEESAGGEDILSDTESAGNTEEAAVQEEAEEAKETEENEEAAESTVSASEKAEKAPFYSVKVKGINNGSLNMHSTATKKNDVVGTAKKGTTGYMIGNDTKSNRLFCYLDGKIVYISKAYAEYTEIDADDYPDELLSVTDADAGKDFKLSE